jgi:D-alanine-D-alanine ligase
MTDRPLRVAVLFGGRSSEHDISVASGKAVVAALDPERYDVVRVEIDRTGAWQLESPADEPRERLALAPGEESNAVIPRAGGSLTQARSIGPIDVVLPILHGPFGEDGTVQGMLEMVGLPYVGSGVMGAALTMDKDLVKRVLRDVGIATAPSVTFRSKAEHDHEAELAAAGIAPPCFVKPARLGSSVGISKVRTIDELPAALELAFRHDWKVLVEQMVVGREIECGVLGNDDPIVSVPGELTVNADWYDFDAKYLPGGMDLTVPAELNLVTTEELQRTSKLAFQVCECAGMARIDFFVTEDGAVVLNEINAIPGFTSTSVYSRLFEASGIGYGELLDRLIALALERHREARGYQY